MRICLCVSATYLPPHLLQAFQQSTAVTSLPLPISITIRFDPPEQFAPFTLAPGLCYNNALENAASAMEVAAVAAKNCVLLIEQGLAAQRHAGLHWPGGSSGGAVAAA